MPSGPDNATIAVAAASTDASNRSRRSHTPTVDGHRTTPVDSRTTTHGNVDVVVASEPARKGPTRHQEVVRSSISRPEAPRTVALPG